MAKNYYSGNEKKPKRKSDHIKKWLIFKGRIKVERKGESVS